MSLNGGFMKIVVIDGQGGRIGSLVTARLCKEQLPNCELYAIGTNATATAAMLKAGADFGATGENPVLVACRDADFIIGPLGILSADSLLGEVTPAMAVAVGQSHAQKLFASGQPLQQPHHRNRRSVRIPADRRNDQVSEKKSL